MISKMQNQDIDDIMNIWLNENISAHNFIPKEYWEKNFADVKVAILSAEVYVYKSDNTVCGFMGLVDNYIAGIFVKKEFQRKGIGKALIDYAKQSRKVLTLNVYKKNTGAVNFYKREGFYISAESTDEDTGEEDYLMTWCTDSIKERQPNL